MAKLFHALFLESVKKYLEKIPDADRGAVAKDIERLVENDTKGIYTKQLKGPVRELIVGDHRITYFRLDNILYFVRGFQKKSTKTPKREIDYADKMFRTFKLNKI